MPARTYELYLESGPKRRKTLVHVLELLGCVAPGPTTDDAVASAPDAIRAYRAFLRGIGEEQPDGDVDVHVAEHATEGEFLGNGSPSVLFGPDVEPLDGREIELLLHRYEAILERLAAWAATRSPEQLDAKPPDGRTERAILLHVIGSGASYPASVLGTVPGMSAIAGAAERGQVPLHESLRLLFARSAERVRATTPEERSMLRERPSGTRTLRKVMRRMLEHSWEHLAELSRRPGGPSLE